MASPALLIPQEIGVDWISPSKTRNYIKGDPILDWLDHFGMRLDEPTGQWQQKQDFFHGFWPDSRDPDYIVEADFGRFIMQKGKQFEEAVTALIDRKLQDQGFPPIVRVARTSEDISNIESVRRTFDLMDQGHSVISQPVLWDGELKIHGAPDLLVRSDILNCVIPESVSQYELEKRAANLSAGYHYVVVEIKYTGLEFNAAGELANSKQHHKVQVALYSAALAKLQGCMPAQGYVIGRSWKDHKKNRGESCLERIGKFSIDQPQHNKANINWIEAAKPACEWIRKMRSEGSKWTVHSAIDIPELRPDMGNTQDAPYHRAKRQIAQEIGEITQLWSVGAPKRDAFIKNHQISDWKHAACTAENLGITSVTGQRLEKILAVNRDPNATVLPQKITWAREEWATPQPVEFFVDFETCNDLDDDFSKLPSKSGQSLIFMIGCGHIEDGKWTFKCFTAETCRPESEIKIIHEWRDHMKSVRNRINDRLRTEPSPTDPSGQISLFDVGAQLAALEPPVFHWSPAEKSTLIDSYDSAVSRHGEDIVRPAFYDFLNRVIKPSGSAECVAVRGAFNFGLKAIGKALHALNLIETNWADGPTDGLGAMTGAWWCYKEASQKQIPVTEVSTLSGRKLFQEIVRYNEIDCKVMFEAIQFLRQLC